MLVALHHAPPGFPCVFDAREIFLYLVWRNATTRASPKYNNSFMERWYIGSGWIYKFEGKMFDIRGKNSGVYNFSSEKENQQAIILVWFEVPVEVSSYNYVQFKYSDVCFCVFLSSVRWGGFGANFDSERMSPTSRPSLSFW